MPMRWKILLVAFLARTGLGFQFQSLAAVSPELTTHLGLTYSELGFLIGLFMLAGVFASVPAGMLGGYFSDRKLIIAGLGLLMLGSGLAAMGNSLLLLAIGRVICGLGFVLGTLFFVKLISDYFDGRELSTALGLLVMSWPVGIASAQALLPWLSATQGWNAALYLSAAWSLTGVLLVWFLIPEKQDSLSASTSQQTASLTRYHLTLTLLAAFVWAVFNAGFAVYLSFINIRLSELGYSAGLSGLLASIPGWLMPFCAVLIGQYADRSGKRDSIIHISSLAAVCSMLLLAFTDSVLPALVLFGAVGASSAGVIMSLTSESMPAEARSFGMGVFFTFYFIVNLPAPAIGGWLLDITGLAGISLCFAAVLFALTALGTWVFRSKVKSSM